MASQVDTGNTIFGPIGVSIDGASDKNTISGNIIGLDSAGKTALLDQLNKQPLLGIVLDNGVTNTMIGGTAQAC